MVDYLLAMDPGDVVEPINGIPGKEPAYDLEAIWIKKSQKEEATFRGYTVVNNSTIIVTHLTKMIEEQSASLTRSSRSSKSHRWYERGIS